MNNIQAGKPPSDPFVADALRRMADAAAGLDQAIRRVEASSRARAAGLRRARHSQIAALAAMPADEWKAMLETVHAN